MPRRFDLGRAVLAAGAMLLFISLFLEWYDTSQTGWQVFEALDLVLTALAVAGIAAAVRPDVPAPWVVWAIPLAAVTIVIVQLVNMPPAAGPDANPSAGAWIALGASLLMAAGSLLSLTSISVIVQVRDREVRRRVAAVDRRGDADAVVAAEEVEEAAAEEDRGTPGTSGTSGTRPGRRTRSGRFAPAASPPADEIERTQPLSAIDEPGEPGKP
jgi:hypothetical protein